MPQPQARSGAGGALAGTMIFCFVLAFVGSAFQTLNAPGFGLTSNAVSGGSFLVNRALLLSFVFLLTSACAFAYLIPVAVRDRYPARALLPFGRGEGRWAALRLAVGATAAALILVPVGILLAQQQPTSISTLLASCPGLWVALFETARPSRPGEAWHRKWAAALVALFQLAGMALATGLIQVDGAGLSVNRSMVGSLPVLAMLAGSLLLGALMLVMRVLGSRAQRNFMALTGKLDLAPREKLFPSVKVVAWFTLASAALFFAAFCFLGRAQGYPTLRPGDLALPLAVLVVGFLGTQVCFQVANGLGLPGLNGAAMMAALGFAYLWNYLFQGLSVTGPQIAGSAITFLGACVAALLVPEVRKLLGMGPTPHDAARAAPVKPPSGLIEGWAGRCSTSANCFLMAKEFVVAPARRT